MARGWMFAARDLRPEPTLAELLSDPIVFALMKADHVDPRAFSVLIRREASGTRTKACAEG